MQHVATGSKLMNMVGHLWPVRRLVINHWGLRAWRRRDTARTVEGSWLDDVMVPCGGSDLGRKLYAMLFVPTKGVAVDDA
jgi:hypothetical protein